MLKKEIVSVHAHIASYTAISRAIYTINILYPVLHCGLCRVWRFTLLSSLYSMHGVLKQIVTAILCVCLSVTGCQWKQFDLERLEAASLAIEHLKLELCHFCEYHGQ